MHTSTTRHRSAHVAQDSRACMHVCMYVVGARWLCRQSWTEHKNCPSPLRKIFDKKAHAAHNGSALHIQSNNVTAPSRDFMLHSCDRWTGLSQGTSSLPQESTTQCRKARKEPAQDPALHIVATVRPHAAPIPSMLSHGGASNRHTSSDRRIKISAR